MTASDRDAARGATESDAQGSRVVGEGSDAQKSREARYAEALRQVDDEALAAANFGRLGATYDEQARAVVAVADAEQAELKAEVERLEDNLSALLCDLTGGRLSKTTYDVPTMVQAIEDEFDKDAAEEIAARDEIANQTLRELRAEVERLTRWKSEATEVILGLQDLGRALELPLGERITGTAAAEAAKQLRSEVERLRAAWQDEYGRARSAEAEVERLQESERIARESERTAWDVHAEHVERMNVMLLRARSLQAEAEDSETAATDRAESSEAALTSECEAHAGLRARLQALADEHEAWMSLRVPAHDLFERDSHRAFVADLRAALADVTPAVQGDTGDAPLAGQEAVCAHDVGDLMPCRCLLPRGHAGLHKCVHTRPTPSGSDEQGNRPATPDANGVHDTKGR